MSCTEHAFISYKSEESSYASQLRTVLEQMGYTVWWDIEIQTGRAWHEEIDRRLNSSKCVIVLWSRRAVESKWVGLEAANAMTRGAYVPCCIERVTIPSPYNRLQAASLVGWDGRPGTAEFTNVLNRIAELVGPPDISSKQPTLTFKPWPVAVPRPILTRAREWICANSIAILAIALTVAAILFVHWAITGQIVKLEGVTGTLSSEVKLSARENYDATQRSTQLVEDLQKRVATLGDLVRQSEDELKRAGKDLGELSERTTKVTARLEAQTESITNQLAASTKHRAADSLIQQMQDECQLLVRRARDKLQGSPANVGSDVMKLQLITLARNDLSESLVKKRNYERQLYEEFGITAKVDRHQSFEFTTGMLDEKLDINGSAGIEGAKRRTLMVCDEFEVALGFLAFAMRQNLRETEHKNVGSAH